MNDLTHIDLFAGIGGFSLAAQWAGFRTIAFCEIESFCQEVLEARFGAIADTEWGHHRGKEQREKVVGEDTERPSGGPCRLPLLIPDIRDFSGTRFRGATLLTAGVPCQPASTAGKRKGTADDRWLWPEALRVLSEARPKWAIFENPPGIFSLERGMVFENLLSQMEAETYEVLPIIIPACGVNAPHRRMRVWIVANRECQRNGGKLGIGDGEEETLSTGTARPKKPRPDEVGDDNPESANSDAPDTELHGRQDGPGYAQGRKAGAGRSMRRGGLGNGSWDVPWIEVATRLCRVDDGLPAWIHARRVARLKALGNAIVPQVAYQIIKAIAEIEKANAVSKS